MSKQEEITKARQAILQLIAQKKQTATKK